MQPSEGPDLFLTLLPLIVIYGMASALTIWKRKERKAELTYAEGFRRWRTMNLYLFGFIAVGVAMWWMRENGITR